jgi:hypothetical protein
MGPIFGENGIAVVCLLLIGGWTTDILDGKLARLFKKPKTRIGENDIFFDSLMLTGVISYLGFVRIIPVWAAFSVGFLLFSMAFLPRRFYQEKLIVESPVAVLTLPALVYLAKSPFVWGVFFTWMALSFLYDIDRAMSLAKIWKGILASIPFSLKLQPFLDHLVGILFLGAILVTLALVFFNFSPMAFQILLGFAISLLIVALMASVRRRGRKDDLTE